MTDRRAPFEFQLFREGQPRTRMITYQLMQGEANTKPIYQSVFMPDVENEANGFRLDGEVEAGPFKNWWSTSFALLTIDGTVISGRRPLNLFAGPSDHYVTTCFPCTWPGPYYGLWFATVRCLLTKPDA